MYATRHGTALQGIVRRRLCDRLRRSPPRRRSCRRRPQRQTSCPQLHLRKPCTCQLARARGPARPKPRAHALLWRAHAAVNVALEELLPRALLFPTGNPTRTAGYFAAFLRSLALAACPRSMLHTSDSRTCTARRHAARVCAVFQAHSTSAGLRHTARPRPHQASSTALTPRRRAIPRRVTLRTRAQDECAPFRMQHACTARSKPERLLA
jgi:hypothetical protein